MTAADSNGHEPSAAGIDPADARGTVLVTGCSSGIGLQTARELRNRGWRVFPTVRTQSDLVRLRRDGFEAVLLDLSSTESVRSCVDTVTERASGAPDALVNNAAAAIPGAVEDLPRHVLRQQFEVNVFGTFDLTNRLLPLMRERRSGRIVMVSSILGLVVIPWRGAYNGSKFALEALTRTLRLELRGSGIHVSLIEPGPVSSRFRDNAISNFEMLVESETSAHRATYDRLRAATGAHKDRTPLTAKPSAVAARVVHALESRRPRLHYYVTPAAYLLAVLRRCLPDRALDRLLTGL